MGSIVAVAPIGLQSEQEHHAAIADSRREVELQRLIRSEEATLPHLQYAANSRKDTDEAMRLRERHAALRLQLLDHKMELQALQSRIHRRSLASGAGSWLGGLSQ